MPGIELSFPRDHGAHTDHKIEWWYVTGQAEAEDGRAFGFQFTVFRSGLDRAPLTPDASPLRRPASAGGAPRGDGRRRTDHALRRPRASHGITARVRVGGRPGRRRRGLVDATLGERPARPSRPTDAATGIGLSLQLEPAQGPRAPRRRRLLVQRRRTGERVGLHVVDAARDHRSYQRLAARCSRSTAMHGSTTSSAPACSRTACRRLGLVRPAPGRWPRPDALHAAT